MFRRKIITQIDIEASPEEIWRHLTDFSAYPEWNPFIAGIEGETRVGSRLTVTMHLDRGKEMVFKPTVKEAEPGKKLAWLGRTFLPGLIDGEHSFAIEDMGDGTCRFVHSESFTGFLVPYLPRSLAEQTTLGLEMFNEVFKERAERGRHKPESGDQGPV